jgi:hypothetical protein
MNTLSEKKTRKHNYFAGSIKKARKSKRSKSLVDLNNNPSPISSNGTVASLQKTETNLTESSQNDKLSTIESLLTNIIREVSVLKEVNRKTDNLGIRIANFNNFESFFFDRLSPFLKTFLTGKRFSLKLCLFSKYMYNTFRTIYSNYRNFTDKRRSCLS